MTRAILIGGPFDGAEGRLMYVPETVHVFPCDGRCGELCSWRDGLHWLDGGQGTRYVLTEIADSFAQYVYGPIEDGDAVRFMMERVPTCA